MLCKASKSRTQPGNQEVEFTWFVVLALLVLALFGYAKVITELTIYDFWLAVAVAALILVATSLKVYNSTPNTVPRRVDGLEGD